MGTCSPGEGSCREGMRSVMRCPTTSSADAKPCRCAKSPSQDVTVPWEEKPVLSLVTHASCASALNLTEPPCLPAEGKAVGAPPAPPLEVQGQRQPPPEHRLPSPARCSHTHVPPGTRRSPAHAGGSGTTHTTSTPAPALSAACVPAPPRGRCMALSKCYAHPLGGQARIPCV